MHTDQHGSDQRKLHHGEITDAILSAFFEVYNELGYGFLESVYQKAMLVALAERGLCAEHETSIRVWFHQQCVGEFRADVIVENAVIVELEAARGMDAAHEAKLLNDLRATDKEVGLLLNFGPKPTFKRFIFDNERKVRRGILPIRVDPRESVANTLLSSTARTSGAH